MSVLRFIDSVRPGMPVAEMLRAAQAYGPPTIERDASDPVKPIEFHRIAAEDVKIFVDRAKGVVTGLKFGPGFSGAVRGVRIGMRGPEVAALLGRPERSWPMPHPDIVLLYDHPEFLRVDVDRATTRVSAIYR